MLSFLSVALLVYASMHLYALGKVWRAFPHSRLLALALVAAGIALTFSPFLVSLIEMQGWRDVTAGAAWVTYTWMGYLVLFFCVGVLADLFRALAAILKVKWPLSEFTAFRTVALLSLALLGYGLMEAHQLSVERIDISTPKLASGRVTIAQISDLHLGTMAGERFLDRIVARLQEIKPDIVVATGDIVEGHGGDLDALAPRFRSYVPPLGAYAVIGNHENHGGAENALRFLHGAGFTVLRGESARAGGIVLAGIDDSRALVTGLQPRPDMRKLLASLPARDYVVLLKHQPVVDDAIPFDLQLSGHIHGGQIFPLVFLTQLIYGANAGLTRLADGRLLYVSRGAGTWGPPIRVFAPPQITLVTIASAAK